jgi:DHA1 family bicyclomycin/chloramphenicol resistance-like MFS transporter
MTTLPTRAHGMSPPVVVSLLTLLLAIQPVATDLYLPALPTLQRGLGTGVAGAQLTLSALIICFGLAQLVAGPLADRFGRRPVLLWGMAAFTTASLASAVAPSIEALIGFRALQGAAMAAAVTCARSMVRDLYAPHDGARMMSRALTGLGLFAMASPIAGGLLVQALGWRATLLATAIYGAATLALVAWKGEETVPARNPAATQWRPLLRNWRQIAAHRTFRAWAALLCCTYGGLFMFLAGSAPVLIDLMGNSRVAYGAMLATSSAAYIAGTFWCRWLLRRYGLRGAVQRAAWCSLAGGASMAALSLAGVQAVWAILVPQALYAMGHGVHQPCGQAGAVGPFPEKAGTAASLTGFLMMLVAFAAGLWLGSRLGSSALPMTGAIGAFSIALALTAWTLVRRDGEAAPRAAATAAQPAGTA